MSRPSRMATPDDRDNTRLKKLMPVKLPVSASKKGKLPSLRPSIPNPKIQTYANCL